MSLVVNIDSARARFKAAVELSANSTTDPKWEPLIRTLSKTCQTNYRTHIAFIGTALLAKATDLRVDVHAVKSSAGTSGAYSARNLCKEVLVPEAADEQLDIGVTGREPLNNQPYFHAVIVSRSLKVRSSAQSALNQVCDILDELAKVRTRDEALDALRAFIRVRREFTKVYPVAKATGDRFDPYDLIDAIEKLVASNSEGGKRAQAVVAALMDVFAGEDRVEVDPINDPDRHTPGDVGVRADAESDTWERVFEVRDKAVTAGDVATFARKCLANKVEQAAVLAVAQDNMPHGAAEKLAWALERGLQLQFYSGWFMFVEEVLDWTRTPAMRAAAQVIPRVHARLAELGADPSAVELWNELTAVEEPDEEAAPEPSGEVARPQPELLGEDGETLGA